MIALTVVNYGFPIAQLATLKDASVPVIPIGGPVMQEPGMFAWRNPWFRWCVLGLVALTAATLLVGFAWLPSRHGDFTAKSLWDSICRAAGVPSQWTATAQWPKPGAQARPTSY